MSSHAKPFAAPAGQVIEDLYNRITGDEDARVCKDIPEAACNDQPRNFFAYLGANLLGKVADEIASAKAVIPWLFGALGVPATFTGFLVPIREAGVLLPQLAVAAVVRRLAIRKGVWVLDAVLSAMSLFGMAAAAASLSGVAIVLMLVLFSLARGLCSVSAKDVLGKTVSKSRRGALMGWSASLSGIAVLAIGLWLGVANLEGAGLRVFSGLLGLSTFAAVTFEWGLVTSELGLAVIFLVLNVMHGGVRLGRKIYLVDMASGDNRAAYCPFCASSLPGKIQATGPIFSRGRPGSPGFLP